MRIDQNTKEVTLTEIEYRELINRKSDVGLEEEILKYFSEIRVKDDETPVLCDFKFKVSFATIARHFYELGHNTRKSIWHNVAEETPTEYGKGVIVACRNKNKEDGIWLYDLIQYWEGKWEPRENWETPVKWTYVRDLD